MLVLCYLLLLLLFCGLFWGVLATFKLSGCLKILSSLKLKM